MATFKIGINMAGAISAGAYTAGVLDFLTEALDTWYAAKAAGGAVPSHDVCIEVFTGASAGGMCAAISAVMLQEDFEHIHDVNRTGTTNRFYESWVNLIDIRELLKTDDLKDATQIVSLLDSSIIDRIATFALTPKAPLTVPRLYVSADLTLFLSLTNLRGVPYSLNGAAPGSIEETTFFYGDRIQFETQQSAGSLRQRRVGSHIIDSSKPGVEGGWDLLQTAAKATGAFPVFLAPRILPRNLNEYTPPMWESVASAVSGTPPPISPTFPQGFADPFQTLNVDGGVTNNDPFNYAHDYLTSLSPQQPDSEDSADAKNSDRAVISIAPFPTKEKFDSKFDANKNASIFSVVPQLFGALISQARFFGESLSQVMSGTTFNRFVIAPSDPELADKHLPGAVASHKVQPPALQCATLGAFGGFFERGFRAHDYALGRRNCQKFLLDYFVLPADNVIMKAALNELDPSLRDQIVAEFGRSAPGTYAGKETRLGDMKAGSPALDSESGVSWLPIIPLCAPSVSEPIGPISRSQMTAADLRLIVKLILQRSHAVVSLLVGRIPSWPLRIFLRTGQPVIALFASKPLTDTLIDQLGDSYKP